MNAPQEPAPDLKFCILGDLPLKIWTRSPAERLRKQLARLGLIEELDEKQLTKESGAVLLLRADALLDAPVMAALVDRPNVLLLSNNEQSGAGRDEGALAIHAPAGLASAAAAVLRSGNVEFVPEPLVAVDPQSLGATYWQGLRKKEIPYALKATPQARRAIEWRMFMGTYKGATDFVTKWLWPWPAYHVTKASAALGLTPNFITFISLLLVIAAFYGFAVAVWWPAILAAWLMTFLDTVDGKLARITLTSSKFGNAFDHGIDLIHPPFWYAAWAYGVQAGPYALSEPVLWWALAVICVGYVLQRVIEGLSILFFKIEIHIWRPIDSLFRQITARRNPNLALLTICMALGRPDWGLLAVAWWTAICLFLHGVQLQQAWLAQRKEGTLRSWMEKD